MFGNGDQGAEMDYTEAYSIDSGLVDSLHCKLLIIYVKMKENAAYHSC